MASISVPILRLPHGADLPLPSYASEGAAGLDLYAAVAESLTLAPGERSLVPTGVCIALPDGYEGQIRARSGLALKRGLGMVNAPGTIDSDYRGEIQIILINWSEDSQTIARGERIAQLVISPVARADLIESESLDATGRGAGGFGHTGL